MGASFDAESTGRLQERGVKVVNDDGRRVRQCRFCPAKAEKQPGAEACPPPSPVPAGAVRPLDHVDAVEGGNVASGVKHLFDPEALERAGDQQSRRGSPA